MGNIKTLAFIATDKNTIFDGSSCGQTISLFGKTEVSKKENEFVFSKGGISLNTFEDITKSGEFTIEATITPKDVLVGRQNVIEAQNPPIALFIDEKGFLVGSAFIENKWQQIKSKVALVGGKSYAIRYIRNDKGIVDLEIDGKNAASSNIAGKLISQGNMGFNVGTWVDKSSYQFAGKISDIKIIKGAINQAVMEKRLKDAITLEAKLKTKLGVSSKLKVNPYLDASLQRLQPIKNIMNAVGVQKISDLGTLQVKVPTVISKGKVLIAPKKGNVIDWTAIAVKYRGLTAAQKKNELAKFLPNRNSISSFENAKVDAGLAVLRPSSGLPSILKAQLNNTPSFFKQKSNVKIGDFIKMDKPELTVFNKSEIIKNLSSANPASWLNLSVGVQAFNLSTLPVNTSVIIAGVLDLTNTQLVINADVEKLYIIAEKIICGPNAKITWNRPGGSTPNRANDPDLNGRGWSGIHTKPDSRDGLDGENGRSGQSGISGANGRPAPQLEMWVKDLSNIPNIDLNGEDGIKGGRGQNGGRGGNGADGQVGERFWFLGWHCSEDPGDGGNGGNGGRGGDGGRGGNGGKGGGITIGVLDGTLANVLTAGSFIWKNQGGQKGQGGDSGSGGIGGSGGRSGVGETCKDAKDGHNGAQAQPGGVGLPGNNVGNDGSDQFFQFSEDAWEELLTRPFITEVNPTQVFPGNLITIKGSQFANADKVIIDGQVLNPTINADESISVTVPSNISGGTKSIFVRRASDATESNRIPIFIKPMLDSIPAAFPPNTEIELIGKAFLNGASVLIDGNAIPSNSINAAGTSIKFTMIGTGGMGGLGNNINVSVRNPDGLVSNSRSATKPRILEIPFTFGQHNLSFGNFTDGAPTWSTYEDTFGAAEVWHEQLDPIFGHPILTAAFYGFYHYFLKGTNNGGLATGYCTSLASLVADKLWKGENNAFTTPRSSINSMLTAIHGKLLSRETLIHFHDQSRQGISRVNLTARDIERTFLVGCDRNTAPLLFFIPSGAIWDSGYIDGLSSSHCLMPYRFVYPQGHSGPQLSPDGSTTVGSLNGVQLFCWDCNNPSSQNCRIEFREEGGVLHYSYFNGGTTAQFDSNQNITLGFWTNGDYNLADHDLPFSGPFGLTSFIIDFLLSPADLEITDEFGLRVGKFGNQIFSEIPDSHPCYLIKGAYLLPIGRSLTRKIVGSGSGKYTYNSLMPDGTTIKFENVDTAIGHTDILMVNEDASQIRFAPHIEKEFTVTVSKKVASELRSVAITGVGGGNSTEMDITISPDLSIMRLGNRSSLKNVNIKAFSIIEGSNSPKNKNASLALPTNHDLIVTVSNWQALDLNVEAIGF